jgi:hypothetical protein
MPSFSITRRERVLTAIVPATTRSIPAIVKAWSTMTRQPSVASPRPHASRRSRYPRPARETSAAYAEHDHQPTKVPLSKPTH